MQNARAQNIAWHFWREKNLSSFQKERWRSAQKTNTSTFFNISYIAPKCFNSSERCCFWQIYCIISIFFTIGAAIAQWKNVRLSMARLGVRSPATKWITVALLGQERSPQPPRQKAHAGFGLPPIAVTKINKKNWKRRIYRHLWFSIVTKLHCHRMKPGRYETIVTKCSSLTNPTMNKFKRSRFLFTVQSPLFWLWRLWWSDNGFTNDKSHALNTLTICPCHIRTPCEPYTPPSLRIQALDRVERYFENKSQTKISKLELAKPTKGRREIQDNDGSVSSLSRVI